ncbi:MULTISPECIES: hemin ABC transporter substrate-binding protein [Citrobacter]|uniref:Hemin ABC transporter substrate-binding protein n=1 Tax=Citrobacter freundii TaxID=546 RepID=A0AAP9QE60_CITFR|nr:MULTISPECIES: hemin ABC transporter substrate-binding protein [Citrobacter]EKV4141869.1 hemin ABC transporter substrate-binding protein [Citrobacter freundii]ELJ2049409.1 hemin ABC transporter substrate-binding protein [Citrobacter freundii]ELO3998175.1 hemin ABC transporter substrate-binding protein [Citrobacter freundii]ELT0523858.1 hemin ABC transporter substrate-binding protein [Citrobacter freundii]KLV57253.1 periplasmic binding protein [Citrobacter sp. MGH104]
MKKLLIGLLSLACVFSAQSADRLVVAGGSLSELIYAMGIGNRVVGVDETTSYPPETAALPHIGYWKQLSSEGILSLHPDSFITWQDAGPQIVLDQLRAQKVNVVTLPRVPATVEQMYANIRELAQTLRIPEQGETLIDRIRQRLDRVQHNVAAKNAPVKAMFILSAGGSAPQVAGKGSVADAIMTLAGAQNVATHAQYKSYSAESLIAANPEVIVVTSQMVDGGLARLSTIAGITHTAAWKNQRIVAIDQALILGMGPRVADAVEALHQQFWPH